jgi:hypothetical protein
MHVNEIRNKTKSVIMKKIQTTIACLIVLAVVTPFGSCLKENDKKADCRIATVTVTQITGGNASIVHNISYNNDGKISTVVSTGSLTMNKVFIYSGNTIMVNTTDGSGSLSSRDSITIDSQGRPLNMRRYYANPGTWTNTSYEYSGEDLVRTQQTDQSSATPTIGSGTTSNGNLISFASPAGNSTFEYYTDLPVQQGDWLSLTTQLEYGVNVYPHKNLIKTLNSEGLFIFNFSYEMNDDGLISKLTTTYGNSVTTITYQYDCN